MKQITVISLILFSIATADAASVVVPNENQNVEGNADNIAPFAILGTNTSMRYQQVYDASQFAQIPNGGEITEIDFRVDATFGHNFVVTLPNIQINLCTTSKSPDSLSPIFSANLGNNDTVVVGSGQLTIEGVIAGPQSLNIRIILDRAFVYDPRAGNLLMDVRNYEGYPQPSPTMGVPSAFDAQSTLGDSVSRIYAYSVNATSATLVDTLGLVTRFQINPIPEPSPLALLLLGASAFGVFARRRRKYQVQQ